jgi:tetratricopeptide (TPR) repeat protein
VNFLLPCLVVALLAPLLGHAAPEPDVRPGTASAPKSVALNNLKEIDAADDAAQADADRWKAENTAKRARGEGEPDAELERKITARFEPVLKAYEKFVEKHPEDARGYQAFGDFLNGRDDERGAQAQWEKALELEPKNASLYNSLAGRYSESGPVNKGFEYFAKAIDLDPKQAAYYHNFADVLFVRRHQAALFYGITEQAVYGRSLLMYSNALQMEPHTFNYARDFAQTFYSLKPLPYAQALQAWTNAIAIARQESDLHDSYVHLARVKMLAGRYNEARAQLALVTNESFLQAKTNLLKNIQQRESEAGTIPGQDR